MFGIVISVIAFAVAAMFYSADTPGTINTGSGSPL
jgi:hypothetical protein